MPRKSSKNAILDALERVIARQGLAATTIEAVAAEAGVSKGGLFYHFASKRDLLLRLMDRYHNHFFALRGEIVETLPDTPNRLMKASLLASLRHPAKYNTNIGNVIALMDDVELRERVSAMKKSVFEEITANSKRPELIALAFLAVDGLWVMDMVGGGHYNPEFQQKIVDELMRLVDVLDVPDGAEASPSGGQGRAGHEGIHREQT